MFGVKRLPVIPAGNDHSPMDYLNQNRDIFSEEKGIFPYWIIYQTGKMSEMVLEFLDRSGGYFLKHNGFDEVRYIPQENLQMNKKY